jgi:hypothetical protein
VGVDEAMITKSYVFTAVTSALLLLLALPLLKDSWWVPGQLASIAVISAISAAIGGLTAETYVIVTSTDSSPDFSETKARNYFTCLITSLLFLAIVVPALRSAIDSSSVAGAATVTFLAILSLAVAGLTTRGLFALIFAEKKKQNPPAKNPKRKSEASADIDSRFKALDVRLDSRMHELRQQLLAAIQEIGRRGPLLDHVKTESPASKDLTLTESGDQKARPARNHHEPPTKDDVVDVLLGKSKDGAN